MQVMLPDAAPKGSPKAPVSFDLAWALAAWLRPGLVWDGFGLAPSPACFIGSVWLGRLAWGWLVWPGLVLLGLDSL